MADEPVKDAEPELDAVQWEHAELLGRPVYQLRVPYWGVCAWIERVPKHWLVERTKGIWQVFVEPYYFNESIGLPESFPRHYMTLENAMGETEWFLYWRFCDAVPNEDIEATLKEFHVAPGVVQKVGRPFRKREGIWSPTFRPSGKLRSDKRGDKRRK